MIQLRNQTDSADDRQPRVRVDGLGLSVTRREPSRREQGVAKWPRRRDGARALTGLPERAEPTTIAASAWNPWPSVETAAAGGLVVVPLVVAWGFDPGPQRAPWPGSTPLPAWTMLLARWALTVIGHDRRSPVRDVCPAPGVAWFAALKTLPKTTARSTARYRVTRPMTAAWLHRSPQAWRQAG